MGRGCCCPGPAGCPPARILDGSRRRRAASVRSVSTLITNIGELVTNAPDASTGPVRPGPALPGPALPGPVPSGPGPFAVIEDAALVIEAGRVAWTGPAAQAPAADEVTDCAGRSVVPGFVDSHAHLVFAGERSAEFAARMAGSAYRAGGIQSTVAATRAASDAMLRE